MNLIHSKEINNVNKLERAEYQGCKFVNCDFSNQNLSNFSFVECTFTSCNFSNSMVEHTAFKEVVFESCKIVGVHFDLCNPFLLKFKFDNCSLDYSSFYQLKITKTNFTECSLIETDFTESNLSQSVFDKCDLSNTLFKDTNLEKVNFITSYNFSINPSKNNIKKASFSRNELTGLLKDFDIIISQ